MYLTPGPQSSRMDPSCQQTASQMYRYSPLSLEHPEIRLISILPGAPSEPLTIEIEHVTFPQMLLTRNEDEDAEPVWVRLRIPKPLRQAIPEGWLVHDTIEGRYLFADPKTYTLSWEFPVPELADEFERFSKPKPSQEPLFEALSYAWGRHGSRVSITVRDHYQLPSSIPSTMLVQPSLLTALGHLRLRDTKRRMWIDAICINQEDQAEKSRQIPYMWAIYRHAWRTVIWLGPDDDDTQLAINGLRPIAAGSVILPNGSKLPRPGSANLDLYRDPYLSLNDAHIRAISRLLGREYFKRLWVISEVAMAGVRAHVVCGNASMSMVELRTAIRCLLDSSTRPPPELMSLISRVKAVLSHTSSTAFSTVVELYRHHSCSEPLDKIYGLLSIASIAFQQWIQPDYAVSYQVLYRQVFLALVKFFERLDPLQGCRLDLVPDGLPSWVPNLAAPYRYWRPMEYCSGVSEPELEKISDERIRVTGVKCCSVTKVHPKYDQTTDLASTLSLWLRAVLSTSQPYPSSEECKEVFCRTICLDRISTRYPGYTNHETKFTSDELNEFLDNLVNHDSLTDQVTERCLDDEVQAQISHLLEGRDFFHTDTGHFGLGPGISREGDIVCAFLGSANLTLLRPVGDQTYQVVGHAFVHGYHDNTAFLGPLPAEWRVVVLDDDYGGVKIRFRNIETAGEEAEEEVCDADTVHDPRLGALPPGWEWSECERSKNEPDVFEEYWHESDRYIHSDPRMTVEALRNRGVVLEAFDLI